MKKRYFVFLFFSSYGRPMVRMYSILIAFLVLTACSREKKMDEWRGQSMNDFRRKNNIPVILDNMPISGSFVEGASWTDRAEHSGPYYFRKVVIVDNPDGTWARGGSFCVRTYGFDFHTSHTTFSLHT